MSFLSDNEVLSWAFGGVGVTIAGWLIKKMTGTTEKKVEPLQPPTTVDQTSTNSANGNSVSVNLYSSDLPPKTGSAAGERSMDTDESIETKKSKTKILFIDDEVKFKVVKILQNAGWVHTQLIKDVKSLDQAEVVESKIIFVDIQGVGIELDFKEEGLGLASALKEKYPHKKIIIYSAEQKGDRFHKALRQVDDSLAKDADPYQFQSLVEEFA